MNVSYRFERFRHLRIGRNSVFFGGQEEVLDVCVLCSFVIWLVSFALLARIVCFFFSVFCLKFQIICFVISTFTPIFINEISIVLPPWAPFVLLSTLVYCQPTELFLGFFVSKISTFPPAPPPPQGMEYSMWMPSSTRAHRTTSSPFFYPPMISRH